MCVFLVWGQIEHVLCILSFVRSNYQFFPWTSDSSFRISRVFDIFCVCFSITNYQVAVDGFRQIDCGSSLSFFPEGAGHSSRPGWCKQQPAQEIVSFHILFSWIFRIVVNGQLQFFPAWTIFCESNRLLFLSSLHLANCNHLNDAETIKDEHLSQLLRNEKERK